MMILALDVGNTNIEVGILYKEKNNFNIKARARFFTRTEITPDELGVFLLGFLAAKAVEPREIAGMIFASVVPPLDRIIRLMFREYFNRPVLEVSSRLQLGFTNMYRNPQEMGADRLVDVAYVNHFFHKNAISIDLGTATTFCVLTGEGNYLGGPIIPGIATSLNALVAKARKLPSVKIEPREKLLTDNTIDAIEAGIYYSNYYAVQGMIRRLAEEAGFTDYITVATGGLAGIFSGTGLFDTIEESLTLKGLKVIGDLNSEFLA